MEASSVYKTSRLTKAVRNMYKKLKKEGHVDEKAGELTFVTEKLTCNNEILRKENEGLRNALIYKKKKRKRGKAMKFHEENEAAG